MTPSQAGDATIEICKGCGGAWMDWFDGTPPELAREAERLAAPQAGHGAGSGLCPRCRRPLIAELFLGGPAVHRCEECFGLFVAREHMHAVARVDETRPAAVGHPSVMQRLLQEVRRLIGASGGGA